MIDERLCDEKHRGVEQRLDEQEGVLKDHGLKIDSLLQSDAANKTKIDNLCDSIKNLVSTLKWSLGICVTTIVGVATLFVTIAMK